MMIKKNRTHILRGGIWVNEGWESFGVNDTKKSLEQGLTLRGMAERLKFNPTYLCDIEKTASCRQRGRYWTK